MTPNPRGHKGEFAALLGGARAILRHLRFEDAARAIFDSCKELIGAKAGYVALLSKDGAENELLFLDPGGLPCTVDPSLPMPIRGLRAEAFGLGRAVYENGFSESRWQAYMPEGHARLQNVLFAPISLDGKAVGLIGLANKEGGFTEEDAAMAEAFGELASVALMNARAMESLEASEKRYHSLVENALVGVYQTNLKGEILYANEALLRIFGFESYEDFASSDVKTRYRNPVQREVLIGRLKEDGRVKDFELEALTKSGDIRSVHISATLEGEVLTGMITDVTERKKAEEDKEKVIAELQEALAKVKTLSGLLPICSYCKKIRNDKGYWQQLEAYISEHSEALFTHGFCPECAEEALKGIYRMKKTDEGKEK